MERHDPHPPIPPLSTPGASPAAVFLAILVAVLAFAAAAVWPRHAHAQEPARTGLEVAGVPALDYDADEGFGYGLVAELYQYGDGASLPYRFTLQPTLFLTTGGRRDVTLFFDAPHVLPGGWRVDAFLGREHQIATPFYGIGNATPYDPALESDANPGPETGMPLYIGPGYLY